MVVRYYVFVHLCPIHSIKDQRSKIRANNGMISHEQCAECEVDFTSSYDGSVVDAATSQYFSAFTLLLRDFPFLSCTLLPCQYSIIIHDGCIQTMRSKYEIRCLSASIIIDSSTFWLSSRCHVKYLQSVPALYAVWLCSALCPRHKYNHSLQLYDRWLAWLVGWTNVQPKHSAYSSIQLVPCRYNCECYVVGCSSSWKWMLLCVRTSSFHIGLDQRRNWYPSHVGRLLLHRENECFCDGLDKQGIGISPIYQLILPHISTTL